MKKNNTAKRIKKKVNKPLESQKNGAGAVKASLTGIVTYLLLSLIISLCLSAAVSGTNDPNMYILPCALGASALSAAVSGAVFCTLSKMSAVASGVINAVCVAAMTLLISLMPAINRNDTSSLGKALLMVVITLGSLVGSAISAKRVAKPKRRAR